MSTLKNSHYTIYDVIAINYNLNLFIKETLCELVSFIKQFMMGSVMSMDIKFNNKHFEHTAEYITQFENAELCCISTHAHTVFTFEKKMR